VSSKTKRVEAFMYRVAIVQGFIGFALFIWAFFALLFFFIFQINDVFINKGIIFSITLLASYIISIAAGFLLGFSMIIRILSTQEQAESILKHKDLCQKLIEFQTSIGFLCLIIGIWDIVYESAIYP